MRGPLLQRQTSESFIRLLGNEVIDYLQHLMSIAFNQEPGKSANTHIRYISSVYTKEVDNMCLLQVGMYVCMYLYVGRYRNP